MFHTNRTLRYRQNSSSFLLLMITLFNRQWHHPQHKILSTTHSTLNIRQISSFLQLFLLLHSNSLLPSPKKSVLTPQTTHEITNNHLLLHLPLPSSRIPLHRPNIRHLFDYFIGFFFRLKFTGIDAVGFAHGDVADTVDYEGFFFVGGARAGSVYDRWIQLRQLQWEYFPLQSLIRARQINHRIIKRRAHQILTRRQHVQLSLRQVQVHRIPPAHRFDHVVGLLQYRW